MALPRSTPSITETFNRLSQPFSEQSGLWLWDAEIPPDAGVSGDRLETDETARARFPRSSVSILGATSETSLTYEPFGDPMQGWAWAPSSELNSEDASLPPLVGTRAVPEPWQQPVQDEPTLEESWHSFSDQPKADAFDSSTYRTPPDHFNAVHRHDHGYELDTAYDSDSSTHSDHDSDVWSAASSSDDEHSRTPDVPADSAHHHQQQQLHLQPAEPHCKPCTAARKKSKPPSNATRPSSSSGRQPEGAEEPQQPCPFCTDSGEDDEFECDGRKTRKRRRKAVSRTTQRHGRWWQTLGYGGPAYCQRCSEVFRDHIIRQKPNSAECNRDHPCHECAKVLAHFSAGTGNHETLWGVIDARGYATVRRRSVAKV